MIKNNDNTKSLYPFTHRPSIKHLKQKKIIQERKLPFGKRQKFIISVIILSIGLFFSEYLFTKFGVYVSFFIGFISDILLYWAIRKDLKENGYYQMFILPFLYCLS